jgi:hypothetical protein
MAYPTEKKRPDGSRQGAVQPDAEEPPRVLTPAAERALAEAAERRRLAEARRAADPAKTEVGGQEGPDPTRYGDWEKNGIISDF